MYRRGLGVDETPTADLIQGLDMNTQTTPGVTVTSETLSTGTITPAGTFTPAAGGLMSILDWGGGAIFVAALFAIVAGLYFFAPEGGHRGKTYGGH